MLDKLILIVFFFIAIIGNSEAQKTSNLLLKSEIFYFGSGQSKLAPKYNKQINVIIELLAKNSDAIAWVAAHTDSVGDYELNHQLAIARANSILNALAAKGIDSSRAKINTYGEFAPYSSNATASGRAQNRRVTVDVLKPFIPEDEATKKAKIPAFFIKGQVRDALSRDLLANAYIIVDGMGQKDTIHTDENGNYQIEFKQPGTVSLQGVAPEYFFVTKFTEVVANEPAVIDFMLEPAIIGGTMQLGGLYFKGGSPVLLGRSETALLNVLKFLKENPKLNVEVGGHINKPNIPPVQESSESFKLSENRAKAVYNYLTSMGISEDRISYKGYGNWQMLFPKAANPAEEQANRRVELKVLK